MDEKPRLFLIVVTITAAIAVTVGIRTIKDIRSHRDLAKDTEDLGGEIDWRDATMWHPLPRVTMVRLPSELFDTVAAHRVHDALEELYGPIDVADLWNGAPLIIFISSDP